MPEKRRKGRLAVIDGKIVRMSSYNNFHSAQGVRVQSLDGNVAAVKPANTTPGTSDPALVVSISPNSAGTPVSGTVTANQGIPAVTANAWPILATDGTNTAAVAPYGNLVVTDEPHQLFYDPFDGNTFDNTNRWNTPTNAGGGVALAQSSGRVTLGTGTTANGYSYVTSRPTFAPTIPGWLGDSWALQFESGALGTLNTYRFWGMANPQATPTAAAPITDGYGFELFTDGKMYAVLYSNGTRTVVQDLSSATGSSKQPTDGNPHRYIVRYRTDRIYWNIDGVNAATQVATAAFTGGPTIQTLPVAMIAVAGSVAPGSSGTITNLGLAVWDTAKNNVTLSDGTYGWRKQTVYANNAMAVAPTDGQLASYSTQVTNLPLVASGNTDVFTIYGSATKTIRITRMMVSGNVTSGTTTIPLALVKRSSVDTGGTPNALSAVPHDSQNAAATATINWYSANPTGLGTTVGSGLATQKLALPAIGTVNNVAIFDFGTRPAQAVVLRGTSEGLCLNLATTTSTGGTMNIYIEWTEA